MWKQKNFPFLRMLRDNYVSFQKEKRTWQEAKPKDTVTSYPYIDKKGVILIFIL